MASSDLLHPSVRRRLRGLRTSLRGRLACEGLAWLALTTVAAVLVTLGLDYAWHFERSIRIGLTAAAAGALGVVVWRQIVRPLHVPMDVPAMALLIENRFRRLADRLITAVEFSARPPAAAEGVSLAMIRRAGAEANELAGGLDFREVVEKPRMRQVGLAAAAAVLLLALFALWQREAMGFWFQRSILFQDVDWPQSTYLQVLGGPHFQVVRGDDLEIQVAAHGEVPREVLLHAGDRMKVPMQRVGATSRFACKLEMVVDPFRFYVTGGDDALDRRTPHRVDIVDPPALTEITFQVEHRAYMGRAATTFHQGSAILPVTPGSTLRIVQGLANKDLKAAWIVLDDQEANIPLRLYETTVKGVGKVLREVRGEVNLKTTNLAASRSMRIVLADSGGIVNRRGAQHTIQVQPDLAASVEIRKRAVGAALTPDAFFPVVLQVKDDYGAAEANLVVTCKGRPRRDLAVSGLPVDAEFAVERELDLKGWGLKPGEAIQVFAEVRDNMPEDFTGPPTDKFPAGAPGPNLSVSGQLEFRIVTPEELREDLSRRIKEARIEFDETVKLQETSRSRSAGALQAAQEGKAGPETKALLTEGSRLQAAVGGECAKTGETLAAILEEMQYNRLSDAAFANKITWAVTSLKDLAKPIHDAAAQLADPAGLTDASQLAARLEPTLQEQVRIATILVEIQKAIFEIESRQEAEKELLIILEKTKKLKEDIERLSRGSVEAYLLPTTQPATQPTTTPESGAGDRP